MFARSKPGDRNNGGNEEVSNSSLNLRLHKDPELGVLVRSLYNQEPVPYPPSSKLVIDQVPAPRLDLNLSVHEQFTQEHFTQAVRSFYSKAIVQSTPQFVSTSQARISNVQAPMAIGVVCDLTQYLETILVQEVEGGEGCLTMTGQKLGNVMQDTAQIAYTLSRIIHFEKEPDNAFFQNWKLHLLVSEGTTPSSGCAIVTSLLSLATQKAVKTDLAISGIVNLSGGVLPVQDVKEKVISAKRSKVKVLILPQENQGDFLELDENVRQGIDVYFVSHYEQIFQMVFRSSSPQLGYGHSPSLPQTITGSSSLAHAPDIPTKFPFPPAYFTLPISKITIGNWSESSPKSSHLVVARFYFEKRKFEWEQMCGEGFYNKMEIKWSTVLSVKASNGVLDLELREKPKLFTKNGGENWQPVEDPNHASSIFRRHKIYFDPDEVLLEQKFYSISTYDEFLFKLPAFPTLDTIYFDN